MLIQPMRLAGTPAISAKAGTFLGEKSGPRGVSLQAQVAVVGALTKDVSIGLIEQVLEAIDLRNSIAHDGEEVPGDASKAVLAVLNFVLCVLQTDYRFVSKNVGNRIMDKEHWEGGADSRGIAVP